MQQEEGIDGLQRITPAAPPTLFILRLHCFAVTLRTNGGELVLTMVACVLSVHPERSVSEVEGSVAWQGSTQGIFLNSSNTPLRSRYVCGTALHNLFTTDRSTSVPFSKASRRMLSFG